MTNSIDTNPKQLFKELVETILRLEGPEELQDFLVDLCSPSELESLSERWYVVKFIAQKVPYRRIQELTGVSTATITRIARTMQYGTGGYEKALHYEQRKSLSETER